MFETKMTCALEQGYYIGLSWLDSSLKFCTLKSKKRARQTLVDTKFNFLKNSPVFFFFFFRKMYAHSNSNLIRNTLIFAPKWSYSVVSLVRSQNRRHLPLWIFSLGFFWRPSEYVNALETKKWPARRKYG